MACQCYSVTNITSSNATLAYNNCITGNLIPNVTIAANSTIYICSKYDPIIQDSGIEFQIENNGSYCDNKCTCRCYSVENTSTTSVFGAFNYRSCITGSFTQVGTPVGYPGSGIPSLVYFCVEAYGPGNGIIDESPQGADLVFTELNDFSLCDSCNIINYCYTWTVTIEEPVPSDLLISYTNTDGIDIGPVEVLTNILVNENIDGTLTYYLCSRTEPKFFEGSPPLEVVPPFIVEKGDTCQSDLGCNPSPYIVYLVSDCCGDKPDGYMELPSNLSANQVVGSSTDSTCYKIVEAFETTPNLDWNGTWYDVGGCQECQTTNDYFCQQEPPTQTPTSTKTPTPTPTITPTPTLTPTPTSPSKIIYFQRCCNVGQYLGVFNYNGPIIYKNSYFSITIGTNTFCVKTVPSVPYPVTLYDFKDIDLSGYDSCEDCKNEHPCPPPPTQQIMGYRNECNVITIFPMNIECVSTSPSSTESNDGLVSVSITGGTPPYKYTWEGIGIGNDSHAPAIDNVSIGDYTVTVVDYWGDFTATTTCTLTAKTDCNFVGTIKEFTPPTQTPTQTPTHTPTPTKQLISPSQTPTNTITPTMTKTPTNTPTSSTPSYNQTFTMSARSLNSITYVNFQGFEVTASLPFRVVWGDGNTTYYPAGTNFLTHTYSPAYTGNILIQSSDLTSITKLSPENVAPQITTNSVKYLEIETSQLSFLDGLITLGSVNDNDYFLSGNISLLPPTLTSIKATYSNCFGDIQYLPPNLLKLSINFFSSNTNQSNTITGNIVNLPPTLEAIEVGGNNALSGDVANFTSSLKYILIDGLNTITGDISLMVTPNLLWISLFGNNTVFGDLGGLSNSVTQIRLEGYNTVTGDISTLPPNLEYIIVNGIAPGGNTLYGNVNTFNYSTLYAISIDGNNNISGNTSSINLKDNASFYLDGNNTITGDIGALGNSFAHSTIIIKGNNTIYGNIQDLPSNAKTIEIYGQNIISGDLSLINLNTQSLYIYGNNTISLFSDSSRIFTALNKIVIIGSGFNSTNLNKLLTSYSNSTWVGSGRLLKLNGTSTPTYTNTTSYNILTGSTKNVVITIS